MSVEILKHFVPFSRYPYEGNSIGCPVCSCDQTTQVASLDRRLKRLPTCACNTCGLLYTNPMPTEGELNEYYSRFYRFDYQGARNEPRIRHLRKRQIEAANRAEVIHSVLRPGSRTLDFGCGSGELVGQLVDRGHDAFGFEPGESYSRYAQTFLGNRIQSQSWRDVDYDQRFDLVSCFHVLEHLCDPLGAMQKMVEWTAPNGLIYIEVPDMAHAGKTKGIASFHFAHVTGFNHHNLLVAGAMVGLRPKKVVTETGIMFEHGNFEDVDAEAEKGSALTEAVYGENRTRTYFFRYIARKIST